ncbi:MAG: hypothetical protein ACXADB_07060 [Candidatus Hermodarchaeia archaeon]|jgi:hypothetical protein
MKTLKTLGLDRVIILVRELDNAMSFFSDTLGVEFTELHGGEEDGCRVSMSLDSQIELISPILKELSNLPPHLKRWSMHLDKREWALVALAFRVENVNEAAEAINCSGKTISDRLEYPDLEPLSIINVEELILDENETHGIPFLLVDYDEAKI